MCSAYISTNNKGGFEKVFLEFLEKDLKDVNVKQKQKSTLDFVKRINNLSEELREFKTWAYLLLGETQFYSLIKSGADIEDLANSSKMNEATFTGSLFDI